MDPAAAAELQQFEQMAQMAMGSAAVDQATRTKAGEVLGAIGQSLKHMSTIQNVLDNSADDFAITAAANSLLRLVTDHWNSFASELLAAELLAPSNPAATTGPGPATAGDAARRDRRRRSRRHHAATPCASPIPLRRGRPPLCPPR